VCVEDQGGINGWGHDEFSMFSQVFSRLQVSWIRKRDLHILTSMALTYTGDGRFTVIGNTETSDDWNLRIGDVQPRDEGIYECQVNTEPKIHRAVYLRVLGGISLLLSFIYLLSLPALLLYLCAFVVVPDCGFVVLLLFMILGPAITAICNSPLNFLQTLPAIATNEHF
jgi:hypothetical protein